MTVDWYDSAYPPNASQCAQAKAGGIAGWAGYFKFGNDGILNGWALSDFQRVQQSGLRTLAYCSGWASPTVARSQSLTWDVEICLDVEGGIRGDGGWVQGWLDAAQSGLYGNWGCHAGRAAAFHVLAAYPTSGDPSDASWWAQSPRPAGLCGWQWAGSHSWAGITVDSSWFDDGIANGLFGPGSGSIGEAVNISEKRAWVRLSYVAALQFEPQSQAILDGWANQIADDGSNLEGIVQSIIDGQEANAHRTALLKVESLLAANPTLAGPPGPPGPAGAAGPAGPAGTVAAHDHVIPGGVTEPFTP